MDLEYVIGLKAGIGNSFAEAQAAMFQASKLKQKINSDEPLENVAVRVRNEYERKSYAIVFYEDKPLTADSSSIVNVNHELSVKVEEASSYLGKLIEEYGENSLAVEAYKYSLNLSSYDSTTGALLPFGYLLAQRLERSSVPPPGMERFFVFIDANDMKYWNTQTEDYADVTRHIQAIGKALVKGTRRKSRGDFDSVDLVSSQFWESLVHRTHGDAGDEFLIDLYCRKEDIVKITGRLFDLCYESQLELYKKLIVGK